MAPDLKCKNYRMIFGVKNEKYDMQTEMTATTLEIFCEQFISYYFTKNKIELNEKAYTKSDLDQDFGRVSLQNPP